MQARIALVTGANRGLGLETARQLARAGHVVWLGCRDAEKGERAVEILRAEGLTVHALQLDVADPKSIECAEAEFARANERLDVLVNNAAIHYDDWQRPSAADFAVVREALETNTLGAWGMCQAFLPLLKKSRHARVVNVSSEAGSLASMSSSAPAYAVSKAALNALTRQLAAELGPRILVNSVCPGWVATDMGGAGGRPIPDGAASIVWAATLPDGGPTGGFFRDGKPLAW